MKNEMEDYYKILGISKNAAAADIKKAYRKMAQKHHPDLADDQSKEKAKAEFQKIQRAYEVLKDPEKRQMYDQLGPDFERMGGGGGPNPFQGHPGQSFDFRDVFGEQPGGQASGGFGFEDFFRQFAGGQRGGTKRQSKPTKGHDIEATVTVPLSVAILGGETTVSLGRAGGPQTISVKIPAGIESGKKIRLRGQGESGPRNSVTPGDLILKVLVAEHPYFRRQGDNLLLTVPITVPEAIRGTKIDVPTPNGTVTVTIPAGSSSGKKLRLRGLGVKKTAGPGDLILELSIVLPDSLGPAANAIADQWTQAWANHTPRQHLRW